MPALVGYNSVAASVFLMRKWSIEASRNIFPMLFCYYFTLLFFLFTFCSILKMSILTGFMNPPTL